MLSRCAVFKGYTQLIFTRKFEPALILNEPNFPTSLSASTVIMDQVSLIVDSLNAWSDYAIPANRHRIFLLQGVRSSVKHAISQTSTMKFGIHQISTSRGWTDSFAHHLSNDTHTSTLDTSFLFRSCNNLRLGLHMHMYSTSF